MVEEQAIGAFAALAHENRLTIFRSLMRAGPSGMSAGDIAVAAGLAPSNVSFHVAQMERAGLLRSWRVRRNIFYAVDTDGVHRLLTFLTEECCAGHPELCGLHVAGASGGGRGAAQAAEGKLTGDTAAE
ncbi:ArsR/SmtB family transcription factor [Thalassobaculum litoreum]|uniref:Transcriptional regulator, ArsR family n=1 Tax=Thalassobaculum litoreum DSM 18839 TaxID=1123362 RepID=A0A8G2BNL8_9PROT|nr:metalloregulator ArsR/SmtB family transcription factor [Thalassobaculum litoreum]SDG45950.1 transcriptional regulator, ArsR family [Thalassobaculum litoreum DSM 18839]